MKLQTEKGEITISSDVFTNITGAAATNCYGVKGMAMRSKTDGLVHLLRRESMGKGVKVTYNEDSSVSIELHIIVDNGVNLMAVSRSIMSEVRYMVSQHHRRGGAQRGCVRRLHGHRLNRHCAHRKEGTADMRESIDGASFAQADDPRGGRPSMLQKQQINELNVFPVPDGDTGTNMIHDHRHRRRGAAQEAAPTPWARPPPTTASALLRGARGNSGVILSLLFRGFAKAVKDKDSIDGRDLAIALDFGVAAAYKAVMKPAEGTILTVSRLAAARAADAARETPNDPEAVLEAAIAEGQRRPGPHHRA